jgi:L,D-transpeptidase ErfK/SrfK
MKMRMQQIAILIALAAAGCQHWPRPVPVQPPPPIAPSEPQATHEFTIANGDAVVGRLQVTRASAEDTFSDIARRFNLGFEELARANPGIDPWLPGADREIVLPTQFVLPDAPRQGLVINLPALRVFYFPKPKDGEPQRVITHPIGIGKVGWSTPEGSTTVIGKRKNPIWTPPESVRKEHRENGDPLPRQVPAGPDNPLGAFAMTLGWPTYLVHGTNKPYGVGMRSSHGCIRFYPEDIALLFEQIPVGTPVHVVNQPLLLGWHADELYLQALPALEDDTRPMDDPTATALSSAIAERIAQKIRGHQVAADMEAAAKFAQQRRGIAVPISARGAAERYVAAAERVLNRVPSGATWDGREELLISAEEYEAARDGKPLPKRAPQRSSTKSKSH